MGAGWLLMLPLRTSACWGAVRGRLQTARACRHVALLAAAGLDSLAQPRLQARWAGGCCVTSPLALTCLPCRRSTGRAGSACSTRQATPPASHRQTLPLVPRSTAVRGGVPAAGAAAAVLRVRGRACGALCGGPGRGPANLSGVACPWRAATSALLLLCSPAALLMPIGLAVVHEIDEVLMPFSRADVSRCLLPCCPLPFPVACLRVVPAAGVHARCRRSLLSAQALDPAAAARLRPAAAALVLPPCWEQQLLGGRTSTQAGRPPVTPLLPRRPRRWAQALWRGRGLWMPLTLLPALAGMRQPTASWLRPARACLAWRPPQT